MFQTVLGRRSMKLVTGLSYIQLMGRLYEEGLSMQIFNHLQSRGSLEGQRKKEERMQMKRGMNNN
jgi:hypothetical protein